MASGDIQAIKDWSSRYFYTKNDINELFITGGTGAKFATDNVTVSSSQQTKVTLGFKPDFVYILIHDNLTNILELTYDSSLDINKTVRGYYLAGNNPIVRDFDVYTMPPNPTTEPDIIYSIDNDGFTLASINTSRYGATAKYIVYANPQS